MKTTNSKISNFAKGHYILEISSIIDTYKDSYHEGQLEQVNCYTLEKRKFTTIKSLLSKKIKNEVFNYIELNFINTCEEKNMCINPSSLCFDFLVNDNNVIATENEIELWKREKLNLYDQMIQLFITVNGVQLEEDILIDLFPKACH